MDYMLELKKNPAYVDFKDVPILSDSFKQKLVKSLEFLSPEAIIVHGSTVSGKRYNPSSERDIDIIVVSYKKNFWNLRELYSYFDTNYQSSFDLNIDITLISPSDIKNRNGDIKEFSWYQSMCKGFSIIEA